MLNSEDTIHITDKGQHRIEEVIHNVGRSLREPEVDILMYLHFPGEAIVEELAMNLKLDDKSLIPALEWLKALDYVYFIPFRPHTTKINLTKSMSEEANASVDYHKRADIADEETAKLYKHIAGEEDMHYKELKKRLGEL